MAENVRHKRHALRKAMKNVIPLKPPLDCAKLAERLREILLGDPSDAERVAFERELLGLRASQRAMIAARAAIADSFAPKSGTRSPISGGTSSMFPTWRCAEFLQVSVRHCARDPSTPQSRPLGALVATVSSGCD